MAYAEADKKPLVIVATGYDLRKPHPLLTSLGVEPNDDRIYPSGLEYPSKNCHMRYDEETQTAVFASGNMAQDWETEGMAQRDEVVDSIARGVRAAAHIDNYLQRAAGQDAADQQAAFDFGVKTQLTDKDLFGARSGTMVELLRCKVGSQIV